MSERQVLCYKLCLTDKKIKGVLYHKEASSKGKTKEVEIIVDLFLFLF